MARMEWLAFELVNEVYHLLCRPAPECGPLIAHVCDTLQVSSDEITFDIVWAPHKMQFDGEQMASSHAGANDRSDFILIAAPPRDQCSMEICTVYHTTNVPEYTSSASPLIIIPETRLLATGIPLAMQLFDMTVQEMTQDLRRRYNVECPALIDVTPSVAVGEVSDAEEEVDDVESVDWDES